MQQAEMFTPIVDNRYLEVMDLPKSARGFGGVLKDLQGRSVQSDRLRLKLEGPSVQQPEQRAEERRTEQRGPPRAVRCYQCGGKGHLARECRRV